MSLPMSFIISAKKQSGTVLLALLLVILAATSYALIANLNDAVNKYTQNVKGLAALQEAKQVLMGYALTYPERSSGEYGPGYLPCPDTNDDGSAESSCAYSTGSYIGRIPWKTLEIDNLKDNAGETIWYALSDNFRNNNKLIPLNSETPGQLSVDGTDDIVAVLIAPGVAIGTQDRSSANLNDAAQYLEGENADGDTDFASSSSSDEFNDLVVTITRTELMRYVERRVLGEVKTALTTYRDTSGLNLAYPWLSPFADPKSDQRRLIGTAGSGGSNTVLSDGSVNFTFLNVNNGDIVHNLTDGSIATVSSVSNNQITTSGLERGTNNSFAQGDVYVIEAFNLAKNGDPTNIPDVFSGSAGSGSSGTTLVDSNKKFKDLGVGPGDVIEDITDGSKGIVKSADNSGTIEAESLASGSNNIFQYNDQYRIRTNAGIADSGSNNQTLVDNEADFVTAGVTTNDYVHNLTDDVIAKVASVTTNQITVSNPDSAVWPDVTFDPNDVYEIIRHLPVTGTRAGQLAFHEPGQKFFTGFQFDWDLPTNTTATITDYASSDSTYKSGLSNSIKQSTGTVSSTLTVAANDGLCRFDMAEVADCEGTVTDTAFLTGTATASSSTTILNDTSRDFTAAGIKPGDMLVNNTDSRTGFVVKVNSSTQAAINNYYSMTDTGISSGDSYRIKVATSSISGTSDYSDWYTTDPWPYWRFYLQDSSKNFYTTVNVGDIVVDTDNGGIGRVEYKWASPYTDWILVRRLMGGSSSRMSTGGHYKIYDQSKYVDKREYVLQPNYKGTLAKQNSSGTRTRSVCVGYNSDCSSTASDTTFSADTGNPLVTMTDYDSSSSKITSTTLTISSTSQGKMKISGLDYYLSAYPYNSNTADKELPLWFIQNNWYQLVYVSMSAADEPGGSGSCVIGTNCLNLNAASTGNNKSALAMMAGPAINYRADCTSASSPNLTQDRTSGNIDAWFECENGLQGDDVFQQRDYDASSSSYVLARRTSQFNDSVFILQEQ